MGTSVTSYNVGLTLDANDYINKARLTRQETLQLQRVINSSRSPADRMARSLDVVKNALDKEAISAEHAALMTQRLDEKFRRTTVSASGFNATLVTMASRFFALSAVAATVRKAIKLDAEMQGTAAAFAVFTGSLENSNKMLGEMRALAERTPLSFRGLADAGKTLMAFNVPASEVMGTLTRLGNVTGGNAQRFQMLSLAYAQSSAAGRLMGQDLLQMINAGFNPLQEISQRTGRSIVDLKKDMEAGLISFAMVEEAFRTATEEGGRFAGMMDKIGETSAGALARAQSKLDVLLSDLGNKLSPLTLDAVEAFESLGPALQEAIEGVGLIVSGLSKIPDVVDEIKGVFEDVRDFIPSLNLFDTLLGKAGERFKGFGNILSKSPLAMAAQGRDAFVAFMEDDLAGMAKARENLGSAIYSKEMNARIDRYLEREREVTAEKEEQKQLQAGGEQPKQDPGVIGGDAGKNAADTAAKIQERIDALKREKDEAMNVGRAHNIRREMEDGATPQQAMQLTILQEQLDWLKKQTEERRKQQSEADAAIKREQENRNRMTQSALDNAHKYFADQRKEQMKTAADMQSKFKAVEVGSAEDARMQAEAMNRLNAPAVDMKEPTEEMILDEARRQFAELQKQTAVQEKQEKAMQAMLAALKDPPVKPRR